MKSDHTEKKNTTQFAKSTKSTINVATLLVSALLWSPGVQAEEDGHRHPGKHEHGHMEINIAIEKPTMGFVEIKAPGMNIFGFEHKATTTSDKEKQKAAIQTLTKNIAQIVRFEPSLECKFTAKKTEVLAEKGSGDGEHNELRALFEVVCKKPFQGSKIKFGVKSLFPTIEDVDVVVLMSGKQISAEIENDSGEIQL